MYLSMKTMYLLTKISLPLVMMYISIQLQAATTTTAVMTIMLIIAKVVTPESRFYKIHQPCRSTLNQQPQAHKKTIQTTVNSFFKACESEKTDESSLDKIQDTVNEILVKVDELALVSTPNKTTDHTGETVNIDDIKATRNLLELANSEKITIETLHDGCRITCVTCKEFIKAMPHMNM